MQHPFKPSGDGVRPREPSVFLHNLTGTPETMKMEF